MALFKRKKYHEKIQELEKKAERAKEKTAKAKALRQARQEARGARREELRTKYPRATYVKRESPKFIRKVAEGVASGGKEIIITTLTSRKISAKGEPGLGRKYRPRKKYYIKKSQIPKGPYPHEIGRGRGEEYTQRMWGYGEEPPKDLFTGGTQPVDIVGSKQDVSLVNHDKKAKDLLDDMFRDKSKKQRLF